jgi:hypothetical protein
MSYEQLANDAGGKRMKIKRAGLGSIGLGLLLAGGPSIAHSPICNCYDNADGTITCEGGFSDGGSAAGVSIRVLDERDRLLIEGSMDAAGTFTFDRPSQDFHVVFDAGQSHVVTIFSGDIEE